MKGFRSCFFSLGCMIIKLRRLGQVESTEERVYDCKSDAPVGMNGTVQRELVNSSDHHGRPTDGNETEQQIAYSIRLDTL